MAAMRKPEAAPTLKPSQPQTLDSQLNSFEMSMATP